MDTARCAAKAGDPGDGQGEAGLRGICFAEPRQAPPPRLMGGRPLFRSLPETPNGILEISPIRDISGYHRISQDISGYLLGANPPVSLPRDPHAHGAREARPRAEAAPADPIAHKGSTTVRDRGLGATPRAYQ